MVVEAGSGRYNGNDAAERWRVSSQAEGEIVEFQVAGLASVGESTARLPQLLAPGERFRCRREKTMGVAGTGRRRRLLWRIGVTLVALVAIAVPGWRLYAYATRRYEKSAQVLKLQAARARQERLARERAREEAATKAAEKAAEDARIAENDAKLDKREITFTKLRPTARVLAAGAGKVRGVAFTPDGLTLLSAHEDGSVRLWDVANGLLLMDLGAHREGVRGLDVSPGGRYLATRGAENTARVWDLRTFERLHAITDPNTVIECVAFSPDSRLLATVRRPALWDVASGREVWRIRGGIARKAAFSPDGRLLAIVAWEREIRLWDVDRGRDTLTIDTKETVKDVAFSPDGKLLATADGGGGNTSFWKVRLWRTEDGQQGRTFMQSNHIFQSIDFSADGDLLASGNSDRVVRIWRVSDGAPLATLRGHSDGVLSVRFSPEGRFLASGSQDGTIRLWDVEKALAARPSERP